MSMTPEQAKTASMIAALCARGYNEHIRLHGPDDSKASDVHPGRENLGFVVQRDGEEYTVLVRAVRS